jgi:hypothetical protein
MRICHSYAYAAAHGTWQGLISYVLFVGNGGFYLYSGMKAAARSSLLKFSSVLPIDFVFFSYS